MEFLEQTIDLLIIGFVSMENFYPVNDGVLVVEDQIFSNLRISFAQAKLHAPFQSFRISPVQKNFPTPLRG